MKYLVQVVNSVPIYMRRHWHTVESEKPSDAIYALLRRQSKAVPRLARMCNGKAYVAVAPTQMGYERNIRANGMPIVIHGFDVTLKQNESHL